MSTLLEVQGLGITFGGLRAVNDVSFCVSPGEIVSLYVDQEHPADISTRLSKAWGFKKYSSIEDALTLGGKKLAVDAGGRFAVGNRWHGSAGSGRNARQLMTRR